MQCFKTQYTCLFRPPDCYLYSCTSFSLPGFCLKTEMKINCISLNVLVLSISDHVVVKEGECWQRPFVLLPSKKHKWMKPTRERKSNVWNWNFDKKMCKFWMSQICNLSSIKTPWDLRNTYLYFMTSLTNYFKYRSVMHQINNHITEKLPFQLQAYFLKVLP